MNARLLLCAIVSTASFFFFLPLATTAADLDLPDLGDASAGLITPAQEYELGQNWLMAYRAQVPTSTDPFIQSYVEQLVARLATYSDLRDLRLDILIIENPSLNAFAVPGGIIGVNTGLFRYAQNEQQFSSVIAHELAHLSQRHYARKVQEQQKNQVGYLTALLASIAIAATTDGDAGIAAISATQAAAIDAQLRFSRYMEAEADRIGMETMIRADMNPYAMPDMFEEMLSATRYQRRPPEFLLTHPVTESRISDSKLRAQQYQRKYYAPNVEYSLIKVRAELVHEKNLRAAERRYRSEIKSSDEFNEVAHYGLAVALEKQRLLDDARQEFTQLLRYDADNLFYITGLAGVDAERGQFDNAVNLIRDKLRSYPNHHALNVRLAEILMKASRYKECETLLKAHVERRPKDDYVWYLLAEVHGLAGNILDVHLARAEYFILNGVFQKAEIQLVNALKRAENDRQLKARVEQRLAEVRKMQREMKI